MLNADGEILLGSEIQRGPTFTIILSTCNFDFHSSFPLNRVASLIPKGISAEIILICYNQKAIVESIASPSKKLGTENYDNTGKHIIQITGDEPTKVTSKTVNGIFPQLL